MSRGKRVVETPSNYRNRLRNKAVKIARKAGTDMANYNPARERVARIESYPMYNATMDRASVAMSVEHKWTNNTVERSRYSSLAESNLVANGKTSRKWKAKSYKYRRLDDSAKMYDASRHYTNTGRLAPAKPAKPPTSAVESGDTARKRANLNTNNTSPAKRNWNVLPEGRL